MKLKQKQLIKMVRSDFEKLGYTVFKDRDWGAVFSKKIDKELYLTLGLTIHRFYDSLFACNYYLSKTTTIGACGGDIPRDCYVRPGRFLNKEEHKELLHRDHNVEGGWDAWWDGFEADQVANLIKVIELTEPRMINQPELILKLEQSKDVEILSTQGKMVKNKVNENNISGTFSFVPPKPIDDIPLIWFQAAELVLLETKSNINKYSVASLASDAFIQFSLDSLDSSNY